MSATIIRPNFNTDNMSLMFPSQTMNALLEEQVYDHFDFYQSQFGVYSFMRLTHDMKHRVHNLTTTPFIWQKHRSCTITPAGIIRNNVQETSPSKAVALSSFCYDELFDSCFKVGLAWDGQGPLELDGVGERLYNQLLRKVLQSMVFGARGALTAGELWAGNSLGFAEGVSQAVQDLIYQTKDTAQGWIQLTKLKAAEPGNSHMNIAGLFTADDFDGNKYVGSGANILESVLGLVDTMREKSTADMTSIMDQGGVMGTDGMSGMPIIKMSTHIYAAVPRALRYQQEQLVTNGRRITSEVIPYGNRNYTVYYIDGMPVIPVHDLNMWDKYLATTTHMAAITVSGNINLGASFTNLPGIGNEGMAVRIKMSDDNEDYGKYSFRSDSLFSTLIADTDFYSGGVVTMTPQ